jgi:hypothetical protein
MATPRCRKCGNAELIHLGSEMKKRALSFLGLASALLVAGGVMQAMAIDTGPTILYAVAGFVILQAGIKWQDHAACYCMPCQLRQYHWLR